MIFQTRSRIIDFFIMLFFLLNEKTYRKTRCADCRKPFSNTFQELFLEKIGNQIEISHSKPPFLFSKFLCQSVWIHRLISFTIFWLIPRPLQQKILSLFRHSTEPWQEILIELLQPKTKLQKSKILYPPLVGLQQTEKIKEPYIPDAASERV